MKTVGIIVLAVIMTTGLVGCSKTLNELRANGDAIVDNGATFATETIGTVSTVVKKILSVGIAVYDMGKKVVEDSKDNVSTAVNVVTGADQTPTAPATK